MPHLLKKQVVRQMINRHHPQKVATLHHQTTTRKRKRKKITAENYRDNNAGKSSGNKEEVKEVSQKEIDEKIKATFARLNVSSKNKRQKIRRDSRKSRGRKLSSKMLPMAIWSSSWPNLFGFLELASLMDVPVGSNHHLCMNLGWLYLSTKDLTPRSSNW